MTYLQYLKVIGSTQRSTVIFASNAVEFLAWLKQIYPEECIKLEGTNMWPLTDGGMERLRNNLIFQSVNKKDLSPGDEVLCVDPQANMHTSKVSHFTGSSLVLENGQYIVKNKIHKRVYKLN